MQKVRLFLFTILFVSILIFSGCGKTEKPKKKFDTKPVSVKQFDTPPGADPTVTAEMGGNGFKGDGWDTRKDYAVLGNPNAVKGGSLVMSMGDFPATLRILGKDFNTYFNMMAEDMLYENLLGEDPATGDYTPRLATHWQVSADRKTFRFRINPDARWADGKPVIAEDIIATWNLLVDPGILDPYYNEVFSSYEKPVAESKYIVSVKSKNAGWKQFVFFATSMKILPAHIIGSISGKEYLDKYQFEFIPGSGPYIIDKNDIKKQQSITIRRRSDYWGEKERFASGLNNFDLVRFDVVTDEALEFEKFRKGETDILLVNRAQTWVEKFDFDEYNRGLIDRKKVYNENPAGVSGIAFNIRKEPFNDIKVRKALFFLFDRDKYIDKLFYKSYLPIDSYFPGTEFANPYNPKIRYNSDSAQRLLSEAGWKERNNEGYLIKDGKIFEIDLPFQKSMERYLTIFQEDLKKAGIKLNLKESDPATMFKLAMEKSFTLIPVNFSGLRIPAPESSLTSAAADAEGSMNVQGIRNAGIDNLCAAYDTTFEVSARVKILRDIDLLACSEFGIILGWYAPYQRIAFHNKFGYPEGVIARNLDVISVLPYLWYNDPEKAAEYDAVLQDKSKKMQKDEEENRYWLNIKRKK